MRPSLISLAATTAWLLPLSAADPTWPAMTDELEEIMYQIREFKLRNFADTITPCSNQASGPGRQNAAEWLRTGFHDMATANVHTGKGGLDAALQYMLDDGESRGPGFNTTFEFMSNYLSKRSSIADLIALGVYASVRSCGGPVIPIRGGRKDAKGPGAQGVPQPEHSPQRLREAFERMGFSQTEMIQLTACGHTLGGVHSSEFPELIADGEAPSDSTKEKFDELVITEYLDNNTTNPLVVGAAIAHGKDSDARIFSMDGNVTVKAMSTPETFATTCASILQKMIDVVPHGNMLSPIIHPYMIKPVDLQLTLLKGAMSMRLHGHIRVRTTNLPIDQIDGMDIDYKDRLGGSDCGARNCTIHSTHFGAGYGFDDTFDYFPIDALISAKSGISSFIVRLHLVNGTTLSFDNNGFSYPLHDAVILQRPQSCSLQHTGASTFTAAIRNDRAHLPVNVSISYKVPRAGLPVAGLLEENLAMEKGECVGMYTLFSTSWTIPGGMSYASRIDIRNGIGRDMLVDDFNYMAEIPGTCHQFESRAECVTPTLTPVSESPASTMTPVSQSPATTQPLAVGDEATPFSKTFGPGMGRPTELPEKEYYEDEPTRSGHVLDKSRFGDELHGFWDYLTSFVSNFVFGLV